MITDCIARLSRHSSREDLETIVTISLSYSVGDVGFDSSLTDSVTGRSSRGTTGGTHVVSCCL